LHHVRQDILLTEGEQDHLFNIDWLYRAMPELVCARSVTARVFTAREGGEQHCQVGNSALAREEIIGWLGRFYPEIRTLGKASQSAATTAPIERSTRRAKG
jgi:hypothetical protein